MDKVEDSLTDDENDVEVIDTSLFWPRNREATSDAKADSHNLFPFEKRL